MGLFDTVIIEKLKLEYPPEVDSFLKERNAEFPNDFQTKDLDCSMAMYKITEDGQLWHEQRVPNGKKVKREPWPRFKQDLSWLETVYWDYREKQLDKKMNALYSEFDEGYDLVFKPSNVTTTINLYTFELIQDKYLTLDYEVILVGGKVVSSRLTHHEIETDEEKNNREIRDKELDENLTARRKALNKLHAQWYYPVIKEVYNPLVFLTSKSLQYIAERLKQLSYKLTKY